jgi:hypothetical protein
MGVCATLTVTTVVPVRDCSGTRYCDANCPGALTAECQSPNPCVANHCATGCPDKATCGLCGNTDTAANRLNPAHPCYVLSEVDVCKATPCKAGCADATKCGSGCPGTTACPSETQCLSNPCLKGCPYKCGCTAADPCPVDCTVTPCNEICPNATNCSVCPNYYACKIIAPSTPTTTPGTTPGTPPSSSPLFDPTVIPDIPGSTPGTTPTVPTYEYPETPVVTTEPGQTTTTTTTTTTTDFMSTIMANPSILALLAVGVVGIVVISGRK